MKYGARDENYDENNITAENKNDECSYTLKEIYVAFFCAFPPFLLL